MICTYFRTATATFAIPDGEPQQAALWLRHRVLHAPLTTDIGYTFVFQISIFIPIIDSKGQRAVILLME